MERFVGIDIGGTNIRIIQASSLELPTLEKREVFSTTGNFDEDFKKVTGYLDSIETPIKGVGIAIPGDLAEDKSMVAYAVHIPGYMNKPLPQLLSQKYACKVLMDNDAATAALGEAIYGTSDKSDFLYIIWGTGVGGAEVSYREGKPSAKDVDWDRYLRSFD